MINQVRLGVTMERSRGVGLATLLRFVAFLSATTLGIGLTVTFLSTAAARSTTVVAWPSSAPRTATAAPSAQPQDPVTQPLAAVAERPAAVAQPPVARLEAPAQTIRPALGGEINSVILDHSYFEVGAALIDLSDGAVHEFGVTEPFEAASTAKVLAAAAYYHLVEIGEASLDDPLGESTSGWQIREMIQNSDNDSWAMIMDAVGYEKLRDYAASIGVSYEPESNCLTPAEMATILADLYSGKLINQEDTAQLLTYMTNTNYEDLIPAAIPEGITVFHKYGLLDQELHDAAILTQGDRAFAFVVYTSGSGWDDAADRPEVIHQLTRAVVAGLF